MKAPIVARIALPFGVVPGLDRGAAGTDARGAGSRAGRAGPGHLAQGSAALIASRVAAYDAILDRPRAGKRRDRAGRHAESSTASIGSIPNAWTELHFRTPFELLVATILSAQCTDARVNQVTPALFARYPTPRALAQRRRRKSSSRRFSRRGSSA